MIINEKQQPNDPIVGCEYVFPGDIDSETRNGSNKISVTLVTGRVWHPIYFTPGSAQLATQESMPLAGRLIENKFEIKIPGGSADLLAELNRICGRSVVLKLTFESGSAIICGGKNRKLRLLSSASLSTQKGNVVGFVYKSAKDFMWLNQ
jgi:hypothetical protein